VEAQKPSKHALIYAKRSAAILTNIVSDTERTTNWPSFLDIRRAIVEDATTLAARLQMRAEAVRERVSA
jgi:hypothetical protein